MDGGLQQLSLFTQSFALDETITGRVLPTIQSPSIILVIMSLYSFFVSWDLRLLAETDWKRHPELTPNLWVVALFRPLPYLRLPIRTRLSVFVSLVSRKTLTFLWSISRIHLTFQPFFVPVCPLPLRRHTGPSYRREIGYPLSLDCLQINKK